MSGARRLRDAYAATRLAWKKIGQQKLAAGDASFFVDRDIRDWPGYVVLNCDDMILEVGKASGDKSLQDLQVTLLSSGYTKFLYANQRDWLSGEHKLPKFAPLRSNRRSASLATAIYTVAFDMAALAQDFPGYSCLSDVYRFPEKLLRVPFSWLGPERFQGFLGMLAEKIRDPEWMLSAFRPGGFMAENFVADDSVYHAIYQAFRTGREPAAVVECLSNLDISDMREDLESFVRRAYGRLHASRDSSPLSP